MTASVGTTEVAALTEWLERWGDELEGYRSSGCRCCVQTVELDEAPDEALADAKRLGIFSLHTR